MSLRSALAFPLRNLALFVLVVLLHCLIWSIVIAGFKDSYRNSGRLEVTTVFVQSIVVLVIYSIWLQRRAIATLRRLLSGGRTLPRLSVSDLLPLRIGSVFSTLFMFVFVVMYMLVIVALPSDLWAHIVAIEVFDFVEAVHLLARLAVTFIALTFLTVIYIVGLARYATEGEGRNAANRITDEFGLLMHRRRSCPVCASAAHDARWRGLSACAWRHGR